MASIENCPVCDSADIHGFSSFDCSITSDSVPIDGRVDNCICRNCALIFNASGTRGGEGKFYSTDYDLLADDSDAEFVYQTDSGARGINDEYCDGLLAAAALPSTGKLLEVGCGKGIFLQRFNARLPQWSLAAVEPSTNARNYLSKRLPNIRAYEGILSESPFAREAFDVVVSIGVLEHVGRPLEFLRELRARVAPGGILMIAVPDFTHNPSDLVVYDHLSRFTKSSLSAILRRAGFEIVTIDSQQRIPIWTIARPSEQPEISRSSEMLQQAEQQATAALSWINNSLAGFDRLQQAGGERRIGIFGTGVLAMAATRLSSLKADSIFCFFDDNKFLQGSSRIGKPVYDLSQSKSLGITDLAFSANPCYLGRMYERARAVCGSGVTLWPLPQFH